MPVNRRTKRGDTVLWLTLWNAVPPSWGRLIRVTLQIRRKIPDSLMERNLKKRGINIACYLTLIYLLLYFVIIWLIKLLAHWLNGGGARGSVVGWGTMLQAGRSPVRVPDEVDFFSWPNPSSRTMALGSNQPLTKMSTRNLPGGKSGRLVGLTTLPPSVSRMSENVGASTSRNPKDLHGLYRDNFTFIFYHWLNCWLVDWLPTKLIKWTNGISVE
jgi:hypothetical protein